jgi:hypothetical protein
MLPPVRAITKRVPISYHQTYRSGWGRGGRAIGHRPFAAGLWPPAASTNGGGTMDALSYRRAPYVPAGSATSSDDDPAIGSKSAMPCAIQMQVRKRLAYQSFSAARD